MTEATNIPPPILRRYCSALFHMWRKVAFAVGIRYGGNSMTKGVSSTLKKKRRINLAVITATIIPNKYSPINTRLAY